MTICSNQGCSQPLMGEGGGGGVKIVSFGRVTKMVVMKSGEREGEGGWASSEFGPNNYTLILKASASTFYHFGFLLLSNYFTLSNVPGLTQTRR